MSKVNLTELDTSDPKVIANILYNMGLDMDSEDYREYFDLEINLLTEEIETLKNKDSLLYHALESIALTNENMFDKFTKNVD